MGPALKVSPNRSALGAQARARAPAACTHACKGGRPPASPAPVSLTPLCRTVAPFRTSTWRSRRSGGSWRAQTRWKSADCPAHAVHLCAETDARTAASATTHAWLLRTETAYASLGLCGKVEKGCLHEAANNAAVHGAARGVGWDVGLSQRTPVFGAPCFALLGTLCDAEGSRCRASPGITGQMQFCRSMLCCEEPLFGGSPYACRTSR